MSYSITNLSIEYEHDVVLARQRAREIAALLGLIIRSDADCHGSLRAGAQRFCLCRPWRGGFRD